MNYFKILSNLDYHDFGIVDDNFIPCSSTINLSSYSSNWVISAQRRGFFTCCSLNLSRSLSPSNMASLAYSSRLLNSWRTVRSSFFKVWSMFLFTPAIESKVLSAAVASFRRIYTFLSRLVSQLLSNYFSFSLTKAFSCVNFFLMNS